MNIKPCPDCSTGWRYAEDLPQLRAAAPQHGLIRCPTCEGQGRVIEPTDKGQTPKPIGA